MFKEMSLKEAVYRLEELDEQITELLALLLVVEQEDEKALEVIEKIIEEKEDEYRIIDEMLDDIKIDMLLLVN